MSLSQGYRNTVYESPCSSRSRFFRYSFAYFLLIALLGTGCAGQYEALFERALDPIPVKEGNVITIRKVPPTAPSASTLKIKWFGTSSYELRMDGVSILTDPFVTYKLPHQVISKNRSRNYMDSDIALVTQIYSGINPPPSAIFIGHSHYDHIMDAVAAMENIANWNNVPVYGSTTTKHILAGYPKNSSSVPTDLCRGGIGSQPGNKWSENWCLSDTSGGWKEIEPNLLYYQSFEATHAPQFGSTTLWEGELNTDLTETPKITEDFIGGKTYIHFFKFDTLPGSPSATFNVGLVGAATEVSGRLSGDLQSFSINNELDVLILCLPGWDKIGAGEYPRNLLRILKPRVILLTHYDNFFDPDRAVDPVRLVPTAKFNEFLNKLQKDIEGIPNYTQFQSILIPGVRTTLYLNKPASGVINVSRLSR